MSRFLIVILVTIHLSHHAQPAPAPSPSARPKALQSPSASSSSSSSWSQQRGVLIHESSSSAGKRAVKDSATSDTNNLLQFASQYDIEKPSVPILAGTFAEASPNVYNNNNNEPSRVDEPERSYQFARQAPHYDSYQNIPIVNGIRNSFGPTVSSRGYNSPSIPPATLVYGTPAPVQPPRLLYGSPAPPPPPTIAYGPPEGPIHSEEQGGYGPGPAVVNDYGPGPEPDDREIRFVVHKEGDESLVKQTLTEKSKWANEHVSFIKGPQFQIEQNQKLYLPPKPKMVVYILLKEPKVNTQVHVDGDQQQFQKPEVFIMYERTNGIEKTHYDLAKDGSGGPSTSTSSSGSNLDGYNYKRDTATSKSSSSSSSGSDSSDNEGSSSTDNHHDIRREDSNISSSSNEDDNDDSRYSADEPKTSSSNIEESVIVKKPKVVCTATM